MEQEVVESIQVEPGKVVFYCKDCEELVDTERCGRKYVYRCKKCDTKNVAFGTLKSVRGFFRLDEKEKQKRKAESQKAVEKK